MDGNTKPPKLRNGNISDLPWGKIVTFYPRHLFQTGKERPEYYLFLILGDLSSLVISLFLSLWLRNYLGEIFPSLPAYTWMSGLENLQRFWWLFIAVPFSLAYQRVYDRRLPFWEETKEIIKALFLAFVIIYALVAMKKMSNQVPRLIVGLTFSSSIFLFPLSRYLIKSTLFKISIYRRRALVLGAGQGAAELIRSIEKEPYLGYEVIGLLDDAPHRHGQFIEGKKVFGSLRQISKFISFLGVETVFVAVPSFSSRELSEIFASVQSMVKEICIVPDFKNFGMLNAETQVLFQEKLFFIKVRNNLKSPFNQFIKRFFDLGISLLLLPFLLPLMGILSLAIIIDSPGTPIFVHERLGRWGQRIKIYKFRTMYQNSDEILQKYLQKNPKAAKEWQIYKKLKNNDPRVTRIGKLLRKTSLDELPQIFNVLKGEMSLVGPRPYLPQEEPEMNDFQSLILQTRPGISGLWQVSGRNKLTFKDRLQMDVWYVLNWSLWLDFTILIKTIAVVLKREGSY